MEQPASSTLRSGSALSGPEKKKGWKVLFLIKIISLLRRALLYEAQTTFINNTTVIIMNNIVYS